ncbi:hypothetical protein AR1Y2_0903 [Anaerostipes rhamnosivorans]|uniref:Uncharacterized protein n=1 Tax=Anaerostipes rhamnosivorans TaxID=1229621 RepID=A0A4P8ICV0_9FIRM|nr:hypothetical protein AR1Y2_0903 [Anaerostipes rhamnosivorans]
MVEWFLREAGKVSNDYFPTAKIKKTQETSKLSQWMGDWL